jgi:hypothetical protein
MANEKGSCPVCASALNDFDSGGGRDQYEYDCPTCGKFILTGTARAMVPQAIVDKPDRRPLLSHYLRKMQIAQPRPVIDSNTCKRIFETGSLPTPQEQADNLIRWLGENLHGPGETMELSSQNHGAIAGAKSLNGFLFVVNGLLGAGLLTGSPAMGGRFSVTTLTFPGWTRYQELRRGVPSGRKIFIAMKYGDTALDEIVDKHFRPAVEQIGFVLTRLDDEPKAGLIDDRMRVEIQSARLVIADLTHGNRGAYWEAGYAEGLGKPVIYTCEASEFEKGTHFDTNHHLTVTWEELKPQEAAERLKVTICATIPEATRENA